MAPRLPAIPKLDVLDVSFFQEAIRSPQLFKELDPKAYEGGVSNEKIRLYLREWLSAIEKQAEGQQLSLWISKENDLGFQSLFSELLLNEGQPSKDGPRLMRILFEQLCKRRIEKEIKAINTQLKLSEKMGKQADAIALLEKLKELRNEL